MRCFTYSNVLRINIDYFLCVAAWVSSIAMGVANFFGPITGGFLNRFGLRITTTLGCLLCSVGLAAGSFAPSVIILYMVFSLPFAVGLSLVYITSTIIITHYFTKRRSLALGFVIAGQGLGQMILGPTLQALVDVFDWRKTFRVFAGILAVSSLTGCLLHEKTTTDEHLNAPRKKFKINLSLLKKPTIFVRMTTIPFFTFSRIVPYVHLVSTGQYVLPRLLTSSLYIALMQKVVLLFLWLLWYFCMAFS